MNTITADEAFRLAVVYHSYLEAVIARNDCRISVSAWSLRDCQEKTGVVMIPAATLTDMIHAANERLGASDNA